MVLTFLSHDYIKLNHKTQLNSWKPSEEWVGSSNAIVFQLIRSVYMANLYSLTTYLIILRVIHIIVDVFKENISSWWSYLSVRELCKILELKRGLFVHWSVSTSHFTLTQRHLRAVTQMTLLPPSSPHLVPSVPWKGPQWSVWSALYISELHTHDTGLQTMYCNLDWFSLFDICWSIYGKFGTNIISHPAQSPVSSHVLLSKPIMALCVKDGIVCSGCQSLATSNGKSLAIKNSSRQTFQEFPDRELSGNGLQLFSIKAMAGSGGRNCRVTKPDQDYIENLSPSYCGGYHSVC